MFSGLPRRFLGVLECFFEVFSDLPKCVVPKNHKNFNKFVWGEFDIVPRSFISGFFRLRKIVLGDFSSF